ncbi:MAG: amino acid permease, partial [Gemmataceae bacterium]
SVMFTFIGYWRTAAVVLCDLASTAYYIGAIVEQSIGPAAPWFILGVMCFSYAVRWVYIESCTLFVRGGVYRVVREAMGGWMAKLAVSALMFDYILTGPISSVSAGHYILGLGIDLLNILFHAGIDPAASLTKTIKNWGAVVLACSVVIYFFYQNLRGIHESSDNALKIMIVTTIMGVIMIGWSLITLAVKGPTNPIPSPEPHLIPRINHTVDPPESIDPIGFIQRTPLAEQLRGQPKLDEAGKPVLDRDGNPHYDMAPNFNWFSIIGLLGVFIAFGHSILAMSGEETLAQVYREVESPKLANFKKAALIVFLYSICLTGTISFLAVIMIPDEVRLTEYAGNLLGGLAMQVWAPPWAKLALQAFVVVVGFLILSGAVNTAIIGSNGVLNRVAEDGVMPDWFLKPHPRFGTTYRLLCLIAGLQIFTIIASQGDVFILGEAYAFGVVWSFVFQALSMMVLRFKRPETREFKVPFNIPFRGYEIPVGLGIILVILLMSAIMNFLTKELATIGGMVFTLMFFTLFTVSEKIHAHRLKGKKHEHLEQFNRQTTDVVTSESLGLTHPYRMLVSIRSTMNLFMLEKALSETDPETTSVVVMTAKYIPPGSGGGPANLDMPALDNYDQQLMTAVVDKAEKAGKEVVPLIVPTNNPLHAILKLARDIQANELILGASNKFTADQQLEQIAFYWINLHGGQPAPLTVRILSRERDMFLDLGGGSRIPKIGERRARTADELREAGVGVDRVLLIHDGSHANSDLFSGFLTMLDEKVVLGVVPLLPPEASPGNENGQIERDLECARRIGRVPQVHELSGDIGEAIVDLARKERYDLIVLPLPAESPSNPLGHLSSMGEHVVKHAHCRVLLATSPVIPDEVIDTTPSVVAPTG